MQIFRTQHSGNIGNTGDNGNIINTGNIGHFGNSAGCPKKKGISKCYSVCFTGHGLLIWSLEYSFLIRLKIDIHMVVSSANPFLGTIRELRNIFLSYFCQAQLSQRCKKW